MRILSIVLVIVGLYLALDHTPPYPLNHEEIGLGAQHVAHTIFGVVALVAAALVWWRSRRPAPAA